MSNNTWEHPVATIPTIRGGPHFFVPGIRELRYLATGAASHVTTENHGELQWQS